MRLWGLEQSNQIHSWKAHNDRVCGIAWSPLSVLGYERCGSDVTNASGSVTNVNGSMTNMNGSIIGQSHTVAFATASCDSTYFSLFSHS